MAKARSSHSRKRFLGGVLGVAAAAGTWGTRSDQAQGAGTSSQASTESLTSELTVTDARFVGETFYLDLGREGLATLKSVDGGVVFADVIESFADGGRAPEKVVGQIKWDDIVLKKGFTSTAVEWAQMAVAPEVQRASGTVLAADARLGHTATLTFHEALITEFGMPALDADSKEAGYVTVKFTPERIEYTKGSGQKLAVPRDEERWLPANFKLDLDGVDAARVSKIDAITIKQNMHELLEFSNLKLSFPADSAQKWIDWHEDFVIKGNNGEDFEKAANLKLYNEGGEQLIDLTFRGVGILSVTAPRDPDAVRKDSAARYVAELYFENIAIKQ